MLSLSHIVLWLVVGLVLAAIYLRLATLRSQATRGVLAVGLMVAAWIYVLFGGLFDARLEWLTLEMGGVVLFSLFAVLGLRHSGYWLAAGWGLHSLWDLGLHFLGPGRTFAPSWYAIACLSFDLAVGAWILWRLRPSPASRPTGSP